MPKYNPLEIEKKWQDKWIKDGIYKFDINAPGEVYAIDNPPSFTSGTLHMGHILNHSWIDFIARYKRMRGYNVLFPLGYDCHGLPTELRVAKEYKIPKESRKEFREKCEEWTTRAIAKMNEQYKRIGYSCDWNEYYETRMPSYKRKVQYSLLKFFEMGRIKLEEYPVLWCPNCGTALAKAEVGHKEEHGHLWYIQFDVDGTDDKITFATTRPELMPACIAVMVHPDDERYKKFVGKKAIVPYMNRKVPIIAEDWVDMEFGTGAVYHCTFGDEDDVKWQRKYNLPIYKAIGEDGRMTEVAGKYAGMKVRKAQEAIVEDLKRDGYLVKEEPFNHNVLAHTERSSCNAPVEFIPKRQWFIKMKDVLGDIVSASEKMKWYPDYMKGRLKDWAENMDWDWIISRQRVYGTPIPFWHCEDCGEIVPATADQLPVDTMVDKPPVDKCPKCGGKLVGTTDTCDCWVDSSISPLVVAHWLENDGYFDKVYPLALRPQGYEIIRTWAFYTIFRDLMLTGKAPFKEVVVNGMVAGPDGRKMAKSYGNVVAPETVLDKEGGDAIRQWALMASLGEDYPFSGKEVLHGLKFQKKYWNASFFASKFIEAIPERPANLQPADRWILHRLNATIRDATEALEKYEFAKALGPIRNFFWHDFCDYYLEIAKDRLYNGSGEAKLAAQYAIYQVLLKSTLLLAPFIPHITEEIHELYLKKFTGSKSVHLMKWPEPDASLIDEPLGSLGEAMKEAIAAVRKFKTESQLPLNAELSKVVVYEPKLKEFSAAIRSATKAKEVKFAEGTGPIHANGFTLEVVK